MQTDLLWTRLVQKPDYGSLASALRSSRLGLQFDLGPVSSPVHERERAHDVDPDDGLRPARSVVRSEWSFYDRGRHVAATGLTLIAAAIVCSYWIAATSIDSLTRWAR